MVGSIISAYRYRYISARVTLAIDMAKKDIGKSGKFSASFNSGVWLPFLLSQKRISMNAILLLGKEGLFVRLQRGSLDIAVQFHLQEV